MIDDLSKRDETAIKQVFAQRPRFYWAMWSMIKAFLKCFPLPPDNIMTYMARWFGAKIGKNVYIHRGVNIMFPFNLEVGDNTLILRDVFIYSLDSIRIGKNVAIAPECALLTSSHIPFEPKFTVVTRPITIEDNVWLGYGATVLMGVTIHQGAVVGARSLVNKDVPPLTMVAGVPAKFIRQGT